MESYKESKSTFSNAVSKRTGLLHVCCSFVTCVSFGRKKFVAKLELQQHQGKLFILNMLEKPNGNSQLSDTFCKGILRLVES